MMRLTSPLVRRQLIVFAVLALVATTVVSIRYLQIPRLLGWGRMHVTAELPAAGGLGANALVTFRGIEIGTVKGVVLTASGVEADIAMDRNARIPAGVTARVHSTSAIGEQYLDLVPPDRPGGGKLQAGDRIGPAASTPVPVDAASLLTSVNNLFRSIDGRSLRTTVDELGTAFEGTGPSLAALLDGSSALLRTAQENLDPTLQLWRNLVPVLTTQRAIGPDVVTISANLADITTQLRISDPALRSLIAGAPAGLDQVTSLARDLHPAVPQLLADLGSTGEVVRVYLPGVKQILVLYPAVVAALQTVANNSPRTSYLNMFFHLNLDDPRACTTGFTAPHRAPTDLSTPTTVRNSWCKVPSSTQTVVRGARNSPCPNGTARAATALGCGLDFRSERTVGVTTYDPRTGQFHAPDGRTYRISTSTTAVQIGKDATAPAILRALS